MNIGNQLGKLKKSDHFCIYLRKSRADAEAEKLGEGETLARHKKILTKLAAKKELYVEKIYHEIVSGESIAARPEMQKLIKDCYDGKYRGIIVIDVDRLSRGNQADMQTIMDCLKYSNNRNGLLVVTPTKTYDVANNYDDEEYIEFVLFMSRREYKTILKRMERGRKQSIIEGNYLGSTAPYGYDILKTRAGRTLIPNQEEAKIVKQIFEMYISGETSYKICTKLSSQGIKTPAGNEYWHDSTIRSIITNPVYIGRVSWSAKLTTKKLVDGKLIVQRKKSRKTDQYMEYDGKHKPIISEEMFKAANNRIPVSKTKRNCKLRNILASIIVCKKCGKAMLYQHQYNKSTAPRYIHAPRTECTIKSVRVSDVIDALIRALELSIEDFEIKVNNLPTVDENNIQSQIEAIEKQIKKTEKKLSKLFDSWEEDLISANEFLERKNIHNKNIQSCKLQIKELKQSIPDKEEFEESISSLHEALQLLKDDAIDADIKNEYLKTIIEKIEFSRKSVDEFILDIKFKDNIIVNE